MRQPPESEAETAVGRRPPPRRAVLRFLLFAALLAGAYLLFHLTPLGRELDRERVVSALLALRGAWWAPLALIGLLVVISPSGLPVSPLVFAGGAAFGVGWGWLYNFVGLLLGAAASFWLAAALGRGLVTHVAPEALVQRVEKLLDRYGFWTLVRVRFVPLPFAAVNFAAALVGVRLAPFLSATAIGMAPSLVLYTYFGYALVTVATEDLPAVARTLGGLLLLGLLLTFATSLPRLWQRRRPDAGAAAGSGEGAPPG